MNRFAFLAILLCNIAILAIAFVATPAKAQGIHHRAFNTITTKTFEGRTAIVPTAKVDPTRVFGSDFIAIGNTQLDALWAKANTGKLKGKTARWARNLRGLPVTSRISTINTLVNQQIRYVADKVDVWKPARTTLKDGFGDCEDYAMLKLALLEAAGVPRSDMMLTIGRHLVLKADHAMLIVRDGDKLAVLDNNTLEIVDGSKPGIYMPILTYSAAGQKWSHTDVPGHVVTAANHVAIPLAPTK